MPSNTPVELKRKVITGAQPGRHLLIVGGVHGDEFESMAAIRRLMKLIDPAKLRGRVTLVPVVNEAAYHREHRCAEDGLDLARTCPGKADGSITERTAWALSELIRQADLFIDLHTGGTVFTLLPLCGYALHPDPQVLEAQRRMARAFNLPIIWGTTPNLNGRSLSVARDCKVPGLYAEYRGAATCSAAGVRAYVAGCLNVMAEFGMMDRRRPKSRIQCVVEDPRDNSGHLQVQNVAPFTGFFEPAVKLGQRIQPGTPLGTVTDVLGEHTETIVCAQRGLVLMVRNFSHVAHGVSVAVVLETGRQRGR